MAENNGVRDKEVDQQSFDISHLYEVSLILAFAPLEATSTSASDNANLTNESLNTSKGTSLMSNGCGRFGCTVSFAYINEFFCPWSSGNDVTQSD